MPFSFCALHLRRRFPTLNRVKNQDYGDLADRIEALREEKQRLLMEDATNEGIRQQLRTIEDFLDAQQEAVTEYDEMLVRKLIDKVTVYDDRLVFEFKSGLEMDVEA